MFRRKAIYGRFIVGDMIFDWTNIVRNDRERR